MLLTLGYSVSAKYRPAVSLRRWNQQMGSREESIQSESPDQPAEQAWRNYVAKHGRKHIQEQWQKMWSEKESSIYWDESEQKFKVRQ
jgi:hypothetical protein